MSKKTAQKVKDREKKVKEKLTRRREAIRKKAKQDRLDAAAQREAQKIANRVDGRTIINRSPEDQHALLQRNLDILKALEDQQKFLEQERLKRPAPQPEQHERARGIKQTAEVCFIPNPETNEPLKVPVGEFVLKPETTGVEKKLATNAEVDFTPNLSDTSSRTERVQQVVAEVLDDAAIDSAATRLAETLNSLSKKRTMGMPK